MPGPSLTTARLVLTPLSLEDAPQLFAYRSLPEVSRFQFFEPRSLGDARVFPPAERMVQGANGPTMSCLRCCRPSGGCGGSAVESQKQGFERHIVQYTRQVG